MTAMYQAGHMSSSMAVASTKDGGCLFVTLPIHPLTHAHLQLE